jgi:hypothetical protein
MSISLTKGRRVLPSRRCAKPTRSSDDFQTSIADYTDFSSYRKQREFGLSGLVAGMKPRERVELLLAALGRLTLAAADVEPI